MTLKHPRFTISPESLRERSRNIVYGLVLSIGLASLIYWGHIQFPQSFNNTLLVSVYLFLVAANLINYVRHRRYLRLVKDHWIQIQPDRVRFHAAGAITELDLEEVAAVNVYRRRGAPRHVQIKRKDNRGIRLEGYGDMEGLIQALKARIPAAHVTDRGA
ncbi:MAG: hypothetical protein IPN92_05715 [Chromatiaceae bacterium]|nr:hypothetical protein [Chromatiaceae bacterium]